MNSEKLRFNIYRIPPKSRYIVLNGKNKIQCDSCGKLVRVRGVIFYKGKFLCFKCMQNEKSVKLMNKIKKRNCISLPEALQRVYTPKAYDHQSSCDLKVPYCLKGEKLKLVLLSSGRLKNGRTNKD